MKYSYNKNKDNMGTLSAEAFGWLKLDGRGSWWIKNKRIENPKLISFINSNYFSDDDGRYYFQNGNQRVFVSLAVAPYILRFSEKEIGRLISHNGLLISKICEIWLNADNRIFFNCENVVGVLDDRETFEFYDMLTDNRGDKISQKQNKGMDDYKLSGGIFPFFFNYGDNRHPIKIVRNPPKLWEGNPRPR